MINPEANPRRSRTHTITLTVNGTSYERTVEPRLTLVDFLRSELGLTGTHVGCEHGVCGACTVLFDDHPVRACIMLAVQANGHKIRTVESLAHNSELHPVQQAFWENFGLQCGFCTAGFLMITVDFLNRCPDPTDAEIREALAGNICRCTGYQPIIESVKAAAEKMKENE
ncbi:MAG: (2Fe-2S)-binding protein [Chloroflexota bacterium]